MKSRLKERYDAEIAPKLKEKRGYRNIMEVPKVTKITLNMGVGGGAADQKLIDAAVLDMTAIAGQKPVVTRAKKAISTYKTREGNPIGVKVTLRGDRMYHFLDKLVSVALPRIRDFNGVSFRAFDGRGNYTLGVKEQVIFPEISYDKIDRLRGMDICITTNARTDDEAYDLLKEIGMPFRKRETQPQAQGA